MREMQLAASRICARPPARCAPCAEQANSVRQTAGPEVVTAHEARARRCGKSCPAPAAASTSSSRRIAQDIRSFTREGLPELERFLREGRSAAREFRDLSRSLREDPSQLLYQQPPAGSRDPPMTPHRFSPSMRAADRRLFRWVAKRRAADADLHPACSGIADRLRRGSRPKR